MDNIIKIPRQLDITELISAMDELNSTCANIIKQVQSRQAINTIILNKLYTCNKELNALLTDQGHLDTKDTKAKVEDTTGLPPFISEGGYKSYPYNGGWITVPPKETK